MRGFGKRLGMLALCAALLLALAATASAAATENCPGGCTHQAAVGTTHYDTLAEAIAAVPAGNTVTVLTDLTLSTPLTIEKSLALDLGGKTLTASLSAASDTALKFTKGGTVRNGRIDALTGAALEAAGCTVAIEKSAQLTGHGSAPVVVLSAENGSNARVNVSGSLSGTGTPPVIYSGPAAKGTCDVYILKNANITADSGAAVELNCAGTLEVSGGTIQAKKDGIIANIHDKQTMNLSITGGKLLTASGEAIVVHTEGDAVAPKDFVTGGTFTKVPTAYVPAYCKIQTNADGTYTVISAYVITFLPGEGSGSMENVKVRCGDNYKLPKCRFTAPDGKDFAGWDVNGLTYHPGDWFTPEADTDIIALWKDHVHSGGKATCQKRAVCEGCGKSYGKKGSHNLSHSNGYAATCTAEGMSAYSKCKTCGKYYVNGVQISASALSLPALGHSWDAVSGTPATCTEDGLRLHDKCATCGLLQIEGNPVTEEDLQIPAAGHNLETVAASQATCTEPGIQAHERCTACDGQFLNGESVELTQLTTASSSHVLSDWISDQHYHWKTCVSCEEVFRQSAHADKDADGSCDDCSYATGSSSEAAKDDESSGFSFLFLIPVLAAVGIAVPLAVKKRK